MKPKIYASLEVAILIPVVAIALSTISAAITFRLGIPETLPQHILATIWVSACVSVPMGLIAAQYDYNYRLSQRRLEELASTDPLTGLLNRRSFRSAVSDERARMARSGNHGALALIDLDAFKAFNDTHGHDFGDFVLRDVAVLLHDELRNPFDKVGRWGGEEFIVLVSNVTLEQAWLVFERLRLRIQDHDFRFSGHSARATASFGMCLFEAAADFDETIRRADAALYRAKASGRNRIIAEDIASEKRTATSAATRLGKVKRQGAGSGSPARLRGPSA